MRAGEGKKARIFWPSTLRGPAFSGFGAHPSMAPPFGRILWGPSSCFFLSRLSLFYFPECCFLVPLVFFFVPTTVCLFCPDNRVHVLGACAPVESEDRFCNRHVHSFVVDLTVLARHTHFVINSLLVSPSFCPVIMLSDATVIVESSCTNPSGFLPTCQNTFGADVMHEFRTHPLFFFVFPSTNFCPSPSCMRGNGLRLKICFGENLSLNVTLSAVHFGSRLISILLLPGRRLVMGHKGWSSVATPAGWFEVIRGPSTVRAVAEGEWQVRQHRVSNRSHESVAGGRTLSHQLVVGREEESVPSRRWRPFVWIQMPRLSQPGAKWPERHRGGGVFQGARDGHSRKRCAERCTRAASGRTDPSEGSIHRTVPEAHRPR